MKILLITIIFVLMIGFFIISNNNLTLNHQENFSKFMVLYFNWVSNLFNNFVTITGNSVGLNWIPEQENMNITLNKISETK